jgi:crotonobetainyl-CoA:carnitine CoA-transferase CaiB-like acyl-CoA transferase
MRPAPKLGEHNEYVLGKILKLSKEEIAELEKSQIIGNYPLAMRSLGV